MNLEILDVSLLGILKNGEYYTLEDLSIRLGVSKADIHKSFMRIFTLKGWSVRPHNSTPYWRQVFNSVRNYPRMNRGRAKGQVYDHDPHEPDWNRTLYLVRRPEV